MAVYNATKLHQKTGASFELIRKLTDTGVLKPVNDERPFLYDEQSLEKLKDYKNGGKLDMDVPLFPVLEKIEATLQEILSRLNNPQVIYQPQHGNSKAPKVLDPREERIKELEERKKVLSDLRVSSVDSVHKIQSYSLSYAKFEEFLSIHEELTGDTEARKKFEELGEMLKSLVPEYLRLKEKFENADNKVPWANYMHGTVMPAKSKWWGTIRRTFGLNQIEKGNVSFFVETPFDLELGERMPITEHCR